MSFAPCTANIQRCIFDTKQEGNKVAYLLPADVRTIWIGIPKEKLLLERSCFLLSGYFDSGSLKYCSVNSLHFLSMQPQMLRCISLSKVIFHVSNQ
jgi:hypothetical protein